MKYFLVILNRMYRNQSRTIGLRTLIAQPDVILDKFRQIKLKPMQKLLITIQVSSLPIISMKWYYTMFHVFIQFLHVEATVIRLGFKPFYGIFILHFHVHDLKCRFFSFSKIASLKHRDQFYFALTFHYTRRIRYNAEACNEFAVPISAS